MAADGVVLQGARASAAMVLDIFWNIPVSAQFSGDELTFNRVSR